MTEKQRVKWRRLVGRTLLALLVLVVAFFALTATGRYLVRAGWEEGRILAGRRPIREIVASPATSPAMRAKLRTVLDARAFARDSLGLATGESFTTYSDPGRDTLVLVLSGAYRDRLKSYTWWFPVVGRVPYKGYFDFEEARREARAFAERGFDARLGPAAAFSTLGWFNDPLLPSTLRADSLSIANTVIHELTHNTFYAPGAAVFNESFANFVGGRGAERFFRSRGQRTAADESRARWTDERIMGRFWAGLYARMDSAFAAHPGDEPPAVARRLAVRDSIYALAHAELLYELGPQLRTISPRAIERIRIDNAVLMARRVYLTELDLFDAVLVRYKGDLRAAVQAIIAAAKANRKEPYEGVRALLGSASPAVQLRS